jgi:hypothetical protein
MSRLSTPSTPSPPSSHHVIESLTVSGGIHFRAVTFTFHDLLNFLIGARGTGKSGVLHLIRFAIGAPIPEAYREEFDEYIEGTLGTGTATVVVRTQHAARYTSSRTPGSEPVVKDENGNVVDVNLVGELFQIQAYAQNELEGIAKNAASQLALVDSFADAEIRAIDDAVSQIERKVVENAARLRRLKADVAEDAARERELPAVSEALKGIDLGGASGKDAAARMERERAHEAKVQRGREHAAMVSLAAELGAVHKGLDAFVRDALQKLSRGVEADLERGARGEVFRRAHAAMLRTSGALESAGERVRAELAAAEKLAADEGRALAAMHAIEDEAYQALVVRDDADRARAVDRERLYRRFTDLSAVAKRLGDRRREEGAAREELAALLGERRRLLDQKYAIRKGICDSWSRALEGEVRATVAQRGNPAPYAEVVTDILKGMNLRPASFVRTIVERIRPEQLVRMVEENDTGPLVEIDPAKENRDERAGKILEKIRASDRTDEILLAREEDAPLIELRVGKNWRASKRLSTGQRCTCILQILLLRSTAPLLVDQAEDSLDNAFIYEVLVDGFSKAKESRQLIVATLNPNPPALADADRIIVLDVDDEGCGAVTAAGTFEEVKQDVERLEGGRKAFRARGERYGHFPRGGNDGEG